MKVNSVRKELNQIMELENLSPKIIKLNDLQKKEWLKQMQATRSPWHKPQYDIHAIISDKKYLGGIVLNHKPHTQIYEKHNLKIDIAITFFFVLKKIRQQGWGKKLINIPLKKYKRIGLTTNTGETTSPAYALYKKSGFKKIDSKGKAEYWYWDK